MPWLHSIKTRLLLVLTVDVLPILAHGLLVGKVAILEMFSKVFNLVLIMEVDTPAEVMEEWNTRPAQVVLSFIQRHLHGTVGREEEKW